MAQLDFRFWLASLMCRNAFYCINYDSLHKYTEQCANDLHRTLLSIIVENQIAIKECSDGTLYLNPEKEVAPGLFCATDMFNSSYSQTLQKYYESTAQICNMMQVTSIFDERTISTAHTVFVDDLASCVATANNEEINAMLTSLSTSLDSAFSEDGLEQNADKATALLRAAGDGARAVTKKMQEAKEGVVNNARYLGPMLNWRGGVEVEVDRRIRAADQAWFMHRGLWSSNISLQVKVNGFRAVVLSSLIDCMHVFFIPKRLMQKLQARYMKRLRALLKGRACMKQDHSEHARAPQVSSNKYRSLLIMQFVKSWVHLRLLRIFE